MPGRATGRPEPPLPAAALHDSRTVAHRPLVAGQSAHQTVNLAIQLNTADGVMQKDDFFTCRSYSFRVLLGIGSRA